MHTDVWARPYVKLRLRGDPAGPLFKWADSRYLTREKFVAHVRRALTAAGYKLCRAQLCAATTAARCGIQDALIKTLGRWESTAYTRTAPEVLCKVAGRLVSGIEPAHN